MPTDSVVNQLYTTIVVFKRLQTDTAMEERFCLACGEPVRGRSDKRFCDDGCRNSYNNRLNSTPNNFVRQINNLLKKNRRILEEALREEKLVKISREKLLSKGFDFDYYTNQLHTAKGQTYMFIYEYGYLPLENDLYLIVKQKQ